MGLIRRCGAAGVFFLLVLLPLPAQTPVVSLSAEIFRLETVASGTPAETTARQRHDAFVELARLHQLSGNRPAALLAYEGALALLPDEGQTLLRQARFLISVGEFEKADAAVSALLGGDRGRELLIQGRFLGAQLQAFRFGNTRHLTALAEDADFAEFRSGIYYTLWRLTSAETYRTRLAAEFPRSPEAGIAAGDVYFAATPLWILFPGRDSIELAAPVIAAPPPVQDAGRFLQAGLFGREANAAGFAEQIRSAGFQPQIIVRQIQGRDHWAVGVNSGADVNSMLRRLQDAGFQAFPLQ